MIFRKHSQIQWCVIKSAGFVKVFHTTLQYDKVCVQSTDPTDTDNITNIFIRKKLLGLLNIK